MTPWQWRIILTLVRITLRGYMLETDKKLLQDALDREV